MLRRLFLQILFLSMAAACQSSDGMQSPEAIRLDEIVDQISEVSTDTQVVEIEVESTKTATATKSRPTATRTPAPTSTIQVATPVITPDNWQETSESGLTPNRKWFVFSRSDNGQIGGFNVDGTGFTWFDLPPVADLRYWNEMATWRNWVAYVTGNEENLNYELVIVRFPEGEVVYRTSIFNRDLVGDYLRLDTLGTMDWSPNGEQLVISTSRYSDDTDLYLFSKRGNRFERLTSEPGYAFQPKWSKDGEWINYREMAGTDEGSGAEIEKRRRINVNNGQNEVFDVDYVFYGGCGGDGWNYEKFTEPSGKSTAYAMVWQYDVEKDESIENGIYIQAEDDDERRLIYGPVWAAGGLVWIKEANLYRVSVLSDDFDGYILFNRDGAIEHQFKEIEFSSDGTMLAVMDIYDRLVIYELDDGLQEIWRVENPPIVSQFYWQPNGKGLIIEALGHLYHVHLVRHEVNLIARDLEGEFAIRNGYWIAQSP